MSRYDCLKEYENAKFTDLIAAYDKGCDAGLAKAWDTAKKIVGMGYSEIREVFGKEDSLASLMDEITVEEAIEKLKDYKASQKQEDCRYCVVELDNQGLESYRCAKSGYGWCYCVCDDFKKKSQIYGIAVGDELIHDLTGKSAIVVNVSGVTENIHLKCLFNGGMITIYENIFDKYWKKTGKNFPQVSELYELIKRRD